MNYVSFSARSSSQPNAVPPPRQILCESYAGYSQGICPAEGAVRLFTQFQKDLNWFDIYLPSTNEMYIIYVYTAISSLPFPSIDVDVCAMGAGTICRREAYNTEFPPHIIRADHPISHLEAVNAVTSLRTWAPRLKGILVHLFIDNATAAAIFQLGSGRDLYIQTHGLVSSAAQGGNYHHAERFQLSDDLQCVLPA